MNDAAVFELATESRRREAARRSPPSPCDLIELTVSRPTGNVTVLSVAGEIDMLSAPVLEDAAFVELAGAPAVLVLDLHRVTFFGASGIAALRNVLEEACELGVALRLARPSPVVRRVFDIVRRYCR
jgi:anti-anti-sigma factor